VTIVSVLALSVLELILDTWRACATDHIVSVIAGIADVLIRCACATSEAFGIVVRTAAHRIVFMRQALGTVLTFDVQQSPATCAIDVFSRGTRGARLADAIGIVGTWDDLILVVFAHSAFSLGSDGDVVKMVHGAACGVAAAQLEHVVVDALNVPEVVAV